MPERNPAELTTAEGLRLLDEIKRFGDPLLVFTGGDPLKRPDLFELIDYAVKLGLRTNVTPSATPLLTTEAIDRFQKHGVARMAISLDGPNAAVHDSFRGIPGTFERAMLALRHAQKIGLETQLQTTVTKRNMRLLDEMAEIAREVGTKMWSLFFLIVTGRAESADDLTGEEYEKVFEQLYRLSLQMPYPIKTTEAMHYRRYILQHYGQEKNESAKGMAFRTAGVSDGRGFVFVSHKGEIYPSGFLPVSGGNVRSHSLVEVYRHSPLFLSLRDPYQRKGKCGMCEYVQVCGGSRARAFAIEGDYLAEDPRCVHQPALYQMSMAEASSAIR
jgi:radical SAM protein